MEVYGGGCASVGLKGSEVDRERGVKVRRN